MNCANNPDRLIKRSERKKDVCEMDVEAEQAEKTCRRQRECYTLESLS